jgi:hypothetical protein
MKGLEEGLWSFPGHWIYIEKIYRRGLELHQESSQEEPNLLIFNKKTGV